MKNSVIYLSGLNGLRAIAALSVLIAHISQVGIADFGLHFLVLPMASFGVTLFFVISGFLITYLLIKERTKTDNICIKKFYFRRILRIWPIYYIFIAVTFLVLFLFGQSADMFVSDMWFYIFFTANIPFIFHHGILMLVHYWSIGVEEQFYLFWPWIVKFSKNRLLTVSVLILLIQFSIKIFLWLFLGAESNEYRFLMITRFHCMMIGAIGAILFYQQHKIFIKFFSNKISQGISWGLFFLLGIGVFYVPAVFVQELIALASLSMIIGQVTIVNRLFNLEKKIFDFVGKISYSVYVFHPLIVFLLSKVYKDLILPISIKYLFVYTSVISLTILVAWLSYTYLEMPFLKYKTKYTIIKSTNSLKSDI